MAVAQLLGVAPLHLSHGFRVTRCSQTSVSSASTVDDNKIEELGSNGDMVKSKELLACPICFQPLTRKGPRGLNQLAISRSGFQCSTCKRSFSTRDVYLDLTITSGSKTYAEVPPAGTELFRNPLVSLVYERGWRQNFERSGFPGPDEELKMALKFLEPTLGGVLIDVSCGSGLFTRRFAKSGTYEAIVALDFSENMLRQTSEFIKQDKELKKAYESTTHPGLSALFRALFYIANSAKTLCRDIALVRADVSRLPFANESVDAIHAAAALHCWPSPSAGVAEICRTLRPGGVFVATTFVENSELSFFFQRSRSSTGLRYFKEKELEELCRLCGLSEYQKIRRGSFIMLSAKKRQ